MAEAGWEMAVAGAANTRERRRNGSTDRCFMEFPQFRVKLVLELFLFKCLPWRFEFMLSHP
jgi:hypothetical protein